MIHLLKTLHVLASEHVRAECVCGWMSVQIADQRTARQAHQCHRAQREERVP